MSRNDKRRQYVREQAEAAVLGGYEDEKRVLASIEELARHELRGDREAVAQVLEYTRRRFEERRAEEAGWTGPSTNDAIDRAFEELTRNGILALQNAGGTLSDGWSVVADAVEDSFEEVRGATFFHAQDVERAVQGGPLMLAFRALEDDPARHDEASLAIAREVRETLARHGVQTEWNGSVETRIEIPPFEWRKRRVATPPLKDKRHLQTRVLHKVVEEKGVPLEKAISALEELIYRAALKHYGENRQLEAHYDPERGYVALFQTLTVVEQLARDPATASNQQTVDRLVRMGMEVEPGDELVFQIFYLPEDVYEARAQDAQYGALLDLTTADRPLGTWTARALRNRLLRYLPAS